MKGRRTKIVATLGPATDSPEMIARLLTLGADVFRLNFSHGTHEEHARRVEAIRAAEAEHGEAVAILQDLQGPKIRTGKFADPDGVTLDPGQTFTLTVDRSPGNASRVGLDFPELVKEMTAGDRLLLRDGLVELRVTDVTPDAIVTQVVVGGELASHSGINVPEADLSVAALSEKDVADLEFGASLGVDWVALSFVRRPEDLRQAREHLARVGSTAKLMAKIEKPGAVARFDEICAEADGIMVARGDLGVEMPPQQVPVIQRRIIAQCLRAGKPVVVATQMLDSMIRAPRPTRAEASDVASAIFDLADAVMLSGETAIGAYPAEAVHMMDEIAAEVEGSAEYQAQLYRFYGKDEPRVPDAVSHSACRLAQILGAAVVASFTWSGATALRVARHRPCATVVALTPFERVARQLALSWGVQPLLSPNPTNSDRLAEDAVAHLRTAGLLQPSDACVVTAGVPFGQSGTTNLVRVVEGEGGG